MSQKYTGLSLAEHRQLGQQLSQDRTLLLAMVVMVGNTYGQRPMRSLQRPLKCLDRLRSRLDDKVCREAWEAPQVTHIYYPGTQRSCPLVPTTLPAMGATCQGMANRMIQSAQKLWHVYPVTFGDTARDIYLYLTIVAADMMANNWQPKRQTRARRLGVAERTR